MKKAVMASVLVLVVASVACRRGSSERINLFPSPTSAATQTPIIVEITTTPVFVQITTTPVPTVVQTSTKEIRLCVVATEAVHVRPSPGVENYPITSLTSGVEVVDLGGRVKDEETRFYWIFVSAGDKQGWVHEKYLEECE